MLCFLAKIIGLSNVGSPLCPMWCVSCAVPEMAGVKAIVSQLQHKLSSWFSTGTLRWLCTDEKLTFLFMLTILHTHTNHNKPFNLKLLWTNHAQYSYLKNIHFTKLKSYTMNNIDIAIRTHDCLFVVSGGTKILT